MNDDQIYTVNIEITRLELLLLKLEKSTEGSTIAYIYGKIDALRWAIRNI